MNEEAMSRRFGIWAVILLAAAGCKSASITPRTTAVSSFSYTAPAVKTGTGQKDWLMLDARLMWLDAGRLRGLRWKLSAPPVGAGVYHDVVSGEFLAKLITRANGRLVPSVGSQGMGLMRCGERPMMIPAPTTTPPDPMIEARLDCRAAARGDSRVVLAVAVDAGDPTGPADAKRRGLCRLELGPADIVLIDLTRLMNLAPQPKLVLAIAADRFEWKDGSLARAFPWGIVRETAIKDHNIRNVWIGPQSARRTGEAGETDTTGR